MSEEGVNTATQHKHHKFHIGALLIVIILVLLLFKFNLREAMNSPQFNQNVLYIKQSAENLYSKVTNYFDSTFKSSISSGINQLKNQGNFDIKTPGVIAPVADPSIIDQKIGGDKIRSYFNNSTDEKINEIYNPLSTPVTN